MSFTMTVTRLESAIVSDLEWKPPVRWRVTMQQRFESSKSPTRCASAAYRQQCSCLPLPVRKLRDVMLGRRESYEALPNNPPSQVERQLANEQFRRALVLED